MPEVGTTDPSSTQPAASSGVNRAESNGEIGAPPKHGVASPTPGGIPSGVSGAQSNGEIRVLPQHGVASPTPGGIPSGVSGAKSNGGVVFSSTNTNWPSSPLQQRSWCACMSGTCTGTPTRNGEVWLIQDVVFSFLLLIGAQTFAPNTTFVRTMKERCQIVGVISRDTPPQHGVASPTPGGIPSGVSGANSNGGVVFSSTNTNWPSAPLQQRSRCACMSGTCTGTPTRNGEVWLIQYVFSFLLLTGAQTHAPNTTFVRIMKERCQIVGVISRDNAYNGPEHFRVRELSDAEAHHLKSPLQDPFLEKMKCSRIFADPLDRLKVWPKFFETTEKSGLELRDGFVTLWSTFILAESLLATVAMQPFITNVPGLDGWRFEMYGLVWMLALVFDYMCLSVTAFFLGYLLSPPAKLSYFWLCNIGVWIGVPGLLVVLCAFASLGAIAYSSWVIYGYKVGIVCISAEGFVIMFAILTSISLGKASRAAESLK